MSKIIQLIEQYAEAREDGAECCNSVEAFNIQTSFEALCSEVARLEQSHAELLQALKVLVEADEECVLSNSLFDNARAAIKNAEAV